MSLILVFLLTLNSLNEVDLKKLSYLISELLVTFLILILKSDLLSENH